MKIYSRRGQAFLALVFFIGSVVAIIGILIAVMANSFVDTGYGLAASTAAEAVATSGAQDAMLKLLRAPGTSGTYSLVVGSSTATVTISQGIPSAGYITVLSTASVSNHARKIQAVFFENASTTQVSVISWQDVQ